MPHMDQFAKETLPISLEDVMRAYSEAMEQGNQSLVEALQRNVYAGLESPKAKMLATWLKNATATLAAIPTEGLLNGELNLS